MNCPFCGLNFSEAEADQACRGCVLHRSCGLIRCPRCGYESFPEPRLVTWCRNRFSAYVSNNGQSAENSVEGLTSLADLQPGQGGCVVRFDRMNGSANHFMKLMAMGLYPGVSIELLRRSPSFVFRTGYSEFAIDEELARIVILKPESEGETA